MLGYLLQYPSITHGERTGDPVVSGRKTTLCALIGSSREDVPRR